MCEDVNFHSHDEFAYLNSQGKRYLSQFLVRNDRHNNINIKIEYADGLKDESDFFIN